MQRLVTLVHVAYIIIVYMFSIVCIHSSIYNLECRSVSTGISLHLDAVSAQTTVARMERSSVIAESLVFLALPSKDKWVVLNVASLDGRNACNATALEMRKFCAKNATGKGAEFKVLPLPTRLVIYMLSIKVVFFLKVLVPGKVIRLTSES